MDLESGLLALESLPTVTASAVECGAVTRVCRAETLISAKGVPLMDYTAKLPSGSYALVLRDRVEAHLAALVVAAYRGQLSAHRDAYACDYDGSVRIDLGSLVDAAEHLRALLCAPLHEAREAGGAAPTFEAGGA